MKKFVASIMVAIMICSCISAALASSTPFNVSTTSTTELQIATRQVVKPESAKFWQISLDEERSNLSPTHRAVTRVHQGYNAISDTWVYSGPNYTQHDYKTLYKDKELTGVTYRGRLDNRDTGTLEFHGNFIY